MAIYSIVHIEHNVLYILTYKSEYFKPPSQYHIDLYMNNTFVKLKLKN